VYPDKLEILRPYSTVLGMKNGLQTYAYKGSEAVSSRPEIFWGKKRASIPVPQRIQGRLETNTSNDVKPVKTGFSVCRCEVVLLCELIQSLWKWSVCTTTSHF
jgi:hypothetical protein